MTTQDMKTSRGRFGLALIAVAGMTSGLISSSALANPSEDDATIAAGTAVFDENGNLLTITTSDMTIIDWLSFNIGFGETVQFIMPDSSSRVLNRISGDTPSEINGTLLANGQLFLVNPSGIVFGDNAVVNAGALYAAAGKISNADFISETYRFTDLHGSVVNRGMLEGSLIALVGGEVANMGTISAPNGVVMMAAGEQVLIGTHLGNRYVEIEIPLSEADPSAILEDDSLRLAAGDIYSLAAWNTGTIDSRHVIIKADGGDVGISGNISAVGSGGNGFLQVNGDNVVVTSNSVTRGAPITSAEIYLTAGPGGVIDLGADLHSTGDGIKLTGDVMLSESVSLTNTGIGSVTEITGDVYSQLGEFNSLGIYSTQGRVEFGGSIGMDSTSDQRLGFLEIDANRTTYFDDVSTLNGMTLLGLTEIAGPSVTFHTGLGTALFGGNIYSRVRGGSDVAFMYDGDVWTGIGEGRTPFKFRGSIGSGPAIHGAPNQGPFRNVYFGGDVNGAMVASAFLFSNAAEAGLELMDSASIDLSNRFFVSATEGIYAGRGQKITSMGSIQFAAKGLGTTNIQLSDVNVLGDLRVLSLGRLGGDITLLGHLGGFIDGVANEADRAGGGYEEEAAELIASGNMFIDGNILTDSAGALLGAESVVLANNSGAGAVMGLSIETFPGGVSLANFLGNEPGSTGLAYAYDLTLGDFTTFTGPTNNAGTQSNLATLLAEEDVPQIRNDDPYLAQRQVLIELGLAPTDVAADTIRNGVEVGAERYSVAPDAPAPTVIIDRLSPRSVERLTDAYVRLFGQRDAESRTRPGIRDVAMELSIGGQDEVEILMSRIGLVLDRIGLLELTDLEIDRAQTALLDMVRPDTMNPDQFRSQWAKN